MHYALAISQLHFMRMYGKQSSSDHNMLCPLQSSATVKAGIVAGIGCGCKRARTTRVTNRWTVLERRKRRRRLRLREYRRLHDSVPSIARRPVSKLTIITEAARLIDQLENAVLNKFQSQGIPNCLRDINYQKTGGNQLTVEDVKKLIGQLMLKEKPQKSKAFII